MWIGTPSVYNHFDSRLGLLQVRDCEGDFVRKILMN